MSIRDDFFASKAVGALWDVAVSIKRGNPLPLDSNSVFESYEALETYVAGPLAYPGQVVAVVGESSTNIYYLNQNLGIQAVGGVPSIDDKTIELNNDTLSLYNFEKFFYKLVITARQKHIRPALAFIQFKSGIFIVNQIAVFFFFFIDSG